ncbi:MAG: hypothetical protein RMI85_02420, partial [Candidatus Korarchaeum sp.]|nr:hypothetical protein [Candidatus Korarchaeum sp.]
EVHPDSKETRELRLDEPEVFIPSSDSLGLKLGDELRLRGLVTATVRSVNPDEVSLRVSSEQKVKGVKIVQWAPVRSGVPARLLVPETPYSFRILGGYGEPALREIKEGEMVQFVRVGFAKLDRKNPVTFILSHE